MTSGEEGPIIHRQRARSENQGIPQEQSEFPLENFDLVFESYRVTDGPGSLPTGTVIIYFRKGLAYLNNPGGATDTVITIYGTASDE